jgi:hypothetical protein
MSGQPRIDREDTMRRLTLALVATLCLMPATAVAALGDSPGWTVFDYNSSGRAISPRTSPNSMPAALTGATVSFQFFSGTYTALLVTSDASATGDLSQKTLSDTVTWSGTGAFAEQNGGGCTPDRQSVRFYFEAPSASGPSIGTPPAGFYTQFWWSNPQSVVLSGDAGTGTVTAPLAWPAAANQWSDWNGKSNTDSPAVTEAFVEASQKVQTIGLSFGGGCFFENGVTTANGGTFTSTFQES